MDGEAGKARRIDRAALADIGPALQKVVDAGDLAGGVTLIWKDGEELSFDAVGQRDLSTGAPMQRDTLFRIASMTKPLTSVAALMLMEEGKLSLDDPITGWAPEFADMKVLKAPDAALDDTFPAPRAITIDDLMTHRAGLAYGFSAVGALAKAYGAALGDPFRADMDPDAWMAKIAALPLIYPPGERFHYSHATDVLGLIVGRIEGKPFRDVLMERIIRPLGMVDTDFWVPPEKASRAARVYRLTEDLKLEEAPFPHRDGPPQLCGGGAGLISTVDDYLKFARMMLNRGEVDGVRLLKSETVDLMTTNRLTDAQRKHPFLGQLTFWEGQGFGLGVSVIVDPEKQAALGPGGAGAFGWPGAFGTWWRADPRHGLIMIYLIQNAAPLGPNAAAQVATGQRGPRAALPVIQRIVYGALDG
jgi:CubicO group peptidase (beta-lactamase class C family)